MRNSLGYTTILGITFSLIGYITHRTQQSEKQYKLLGEQAKTEIKAKDYNRYIDCLENVDRRELSGLNRTEFWITQQKTMNDSIKNLKLDSLASESAYAKWLKSVDKSQLKYIKKGLKTIR